MRWSLVIVVGFTAISTWMLTSNFSSAQAADKRVWQYHCVLPPGALPPKHEASDTHETKGEHAHSGRGHHPAEAVLNHLGGKGWELVAIDPNNGHYCFKRRP